MQNPLGNGPGRRLPRGGRRRRQGIKEKRIRNGTQQIYHGIGLKEDLKGRNRQKIMSYGTFSGGEFGYAVHSFAGGNGLERKEKKIYIWHSKKNPAKKNFERGESVGLGGKRRISFFYFLQPFLM